MARGMSGRVLGYIQSRPHRVISRSSCGKVVRPPTAHKALTRWCCNTTECREPASYMHTPILRTPEALPFPSIPVDSRASTLCPEQTPRALQVLLACVVCACVCVCVCVCARACTPQIYRCLHVSGIYTHIYGVGCCED